MKKLSQILESINEVDSIVREIEFKTPEDFKKYKAKHKMRPGTVVKVAGKDKVIDDPKKNTKPKGDTTADTLTKGLKDGGLNPYKDGPMINQALDDIGGDHSDLKKKIDTYGDNVPSSRGKSEAQYQKEIDKYKEEGEKLSNDIVDAISDDIKELSKITTRYTNRIDERSTLTLRGKNGKMVDVPREYARIISGIDRLMSKFNPRGVMFGYRKYHKLKPNDEYSGSIILKNPLSKKDIDVVMKHLKSAGSSLGFKFEKITFNPDRNEPFVEFRVNNASIK